jgi:branched-chain amino acid transport system ATP-binding protein
LTVRENLIATAAQRDGRNHWTLQRIYELFPRLAERANQYANTLSGGEQQMLAVGRALMTNPKLLILDEATEGLAPVVRGEIWRCIEALKECGQSILLIDKNVNVLKRLADHHFILEKGRTVWSGDSAALQRETATLQRYLGI